MSDEEIERAGRHMADAVESMIQSRALTLRVAEWVDVMRALRAAGADRELELIIAAFNTEVS